jgi:Flp pilus assembly protein TadD
MTIWRVAVPAAVLCLFAVALPIGLPRASSTVSDEQCLTLADTPPPAARADILTAFERCSALYPGDTQLLADLGALYEAAGTPQRAEVQYQRALQIDPDFADLRLRLGRLLLKRGAAAEARREAIAALAVQPNRQSLLDLRHDADVRLAGPAR